MRKLSEVRAARDVLVERCLYIRNMDEIHGIECHGQEMPPEDVFDAMVAECKRLEAKYGVEFLTPDDEFMVGDLHGRLEALRWALGAEWSEDIDTEV